LDEAERELNNLKNRSNSGDKDLVFLQIRLADAFKKNKELQKAVHHASQSYTGAKALQKERSMQQMEVDKLLLITNFVLTDAYLEMKDRKRATETSTDLIELALSIPSANLYSAALDRFSNLTELNLDPSKLNIVPDRTAPDLQISKWLDPKSTTLNDMKGKVVLLEFWATWCKPCLASFPVLRRWQDRYKNKGFAILGLTRYYGSERWPKMEPEQELRFLRTFRNTHKLTFPIAVSDSVDNELNYSVRGIPTSILIDRRGRVRFMAIGSGPDDQSMIESMIEKLLNEKN
jgi:thiol-disulfide isomerase/thioredoxin